MNPRPLCVAAALLAAGVAGRSLEASAQQHPLWGGLTPGFHGVGFRRLWELDESRVWPRSPAIDSVEGVVARPVRIDVWYPAHCRGEDRMSVRSYLEMVSPAPHFDDLVFLAHRWDEYSYRGLTGDSTAFDRLMDAETAACLDATAAAGRFPLVVYSAGWFNRAPDNAVLAEYLASHGYVVASVPQLNPGLWTFDFTSDATSVENQVRDLEVALGALASDPVVDHRRVAAMGYSTGGDVALLLAGRSPLVDAVVGLDASWTLGPENDAITSPFLQPERHALPMLVMRRPVERERMMAANQLLDQLSAAPRLVVEIPEADHGTFSDDPVHRRFLGVEPAVGEEAHAAVMRAVLEFLEGVLMKPEGSFDGSGLAERWANRGLKATLRPAAAPGDDGTAGSGGSSPPVPPPRRTPAPGLTPKGRAETVSWSPSGCGGGGPLPSRTRVAGARLGPHAARCLVVLLLARKGVKPARDRWEAGGGAPVAALETLVVNREALYGWGLVGVCMEWPDLDVEGAVLPEFSRSF